MRRPSIRFTMWRMMQAVAVAAVLLKAVSFPPASPAVFGLAVAVAVHFILLRGGHFQAGWVAWGFGLGSVLGILYYERADRSVWRSLSMERGMAAATIAPVLIIALALLRVHHARHKASRDGTYSGGT